MEKMKVIILLTTIILFSCQRSNHLNWTTNKESEQVLRSMPSKLKTLPNVLTEEEAFIGLGFNKTLNGNPQYGSSGHTLTEYTFANSQYTIMVLTSIWERETYVRQITIVGPSSKKYCRDFAWPKKMKP